MTNFYTTSDHYREQEAQARAAESIFRYDIANYGEPRIILITDHIGKRSELPRLGTVVLPQR